LEAHLERVILGKLRGVIPMLDLIAVLVSVVAGVTYGTFVMTLLRRKVTERSGAFRKAKELFFVELRKRIALGVIQDLDDVAMVKNWASREQESNRFGTVPLDELLEEFLCVITRNEEGEERVREDYRFVESLIDTKRVQEPFSILPSEERIKAQRLQRSIDSGQKEEAVSQLQELTNLLGGKLEAIGKTATRNRNLAIVAVIASISAIPIAIIF